MRSKNRIIDLFKNRIFKNMSEKNLKIQFLFLRERTGAACCRCQFSQSPCGRIINTLDLNVIQ